MKSFLITGASKGIGLAIAKQLVGGGSTVYATYLTTDSGEIERISKETGIIFYKVDLSVRAKVLEFLDNLSGVVFDGLVNNAGMFEVEDVSKYNLDSWDKVMQLNVTTPLMLATTLHMNDEGASIVNIASTDAFVAAYVGVSYAASKSALISITKSLAVNYAPKIRVNAVAPGWIDTSMGADATGVGTEAVAKNPLGRNGKPEEVADLVCFLLSDKASFINAEIITIDGGYSVVDEVMKREWENTLAK